MAPASSTPAPTPPRDPWEGARLVVPSSLMRLRPPWIVGRPFAVAPIVALALAALASGCGPSLRLSQQSRVYFERCYAADFDVRIALAEKHACWTSWLAHYTIGDGAGRSDYARERLYAIEHGESVPRLPGLPQAALGPRAATPVTAASAPSPDPDPAVDETLPADRVDLPRGRRSPRDRHAPPLPRTANPACATAACEPTWRACIDTCDGVEACETACRVELSACARGCF